MWFDVVPSLLICLSHLMCSSLEGMTSSKEGKRGAEVVMKGRGGQKQAALAWATEEKMRN